MHDYTMLSGSNNYNNHNAIMHDHTMLSGSNNYNNHNAIIHDHIILSASDTHKFGSSTGRWIRVAYVILLNLSAANN